MSFHAPFKCDISSCKEGCVNPSIMVETDSIKTCIQDDEPPPPHPPPPHIDLCIMFDRGVSYLASTEKCFLPPPFHIVSLHLIQEGDPLKTYPVQLHKSLIYRYSDINCN